MNHALDAHEKEWVLLVPPKLTKSTYNLLVESDCVARPWHLAGRHGSRTHSHEDGTRIAIPILSDVIVLEASKDSSELQKVLATDGVEMVQKAVHVSKRHPAGPPAFNATIHSERAPPDYIVPTNRKRKLERAPTFTFAELFAGLGGFGVALEALGGTCVFCSELEESCRAVYQQNLTVDKTRIYGDIYAVKNEEFPTCVDLLVAGFPCQPFSSLGQQPGLDCDKGVLFQEIVRFLCISKPRAFLLENVPGLLGMKETFNVILEALRDCGYNVSFEILDARGLTATTRKRLYIVGLLKTQESMTAFEFPFVPDLQLRARNVLNNENDENDLLRTTDEQLQRLVESKHWKPAHLAWPNTTIKTLVSHYGNSIARGDSQLVPCATGNPRRFSPRECASLMGFPRHYQLPRKQDAAQGDIAFLKSQYRMFGNAVCPPVIAVLAGAVLAKCQGDDSEFDWAEHGREMAIKLAYEATVSK